MFYGVKMKLKKKEICMVSTMFHVLSNNKAYEHNMLLITASESGK